ncbi:MAG: AI-2E family transporter [Pseudohongiellaceae bacterium]
MHNKMENYSFVITLGVISLLFLYLLKPFFGAVFWACVIVLLFYPVHLKLQRKLGPRPNLAATISLIICVIIGIIPTLFVLGSFFQEGASLYNRLESGELDLGSYLNRIAEAFPFVQELLNDFEVDVESLQQRLGEAALAATGLLAENAVRVGQGAMLFFLNLALMIYILFFLFRDGPRLTKLLVRALPLGDDRERLLLAKFSEVTRATIKGNLVIAVVQGTLGGLVFWALGISGPLLWGVVMVLVSLIPVIGAGIIWGPVAIYLFANGQVTQGVILVVFGIGVIGLVDNLLRPILVGRDTKLPDYIVLLSTLGGIALFGINGFVIGPLIAALFMAFWGIFMREFNTESKPVEISGSLDNQE